MRRRLIAVLMTLAMLVLGCTPGGEAPSPTPTAETALPEDVVSADDAATAVVAALNAAYDVPVKQISNVVNVSSQTEAFALGIFCDN